MTSFYKKKDDKFVCTLCNHYCELDTNQIGLCGVNKNTGNKVECLAYGYISAFNIDPIEKKPLYHFLPQSKSLSLGTVGCNFKCSFCQNWGISQEKKINKEKYTSPKNVVLQAVKNKCLSISYTYNEPTIFYPYARNIALEAKKYGIKSVFVSNGFESKEVIEDMKGIIDAINVDLKCFDDKYYKKLGGSLGKVLENLKAFVKNKIHLEITTLIVPTKNDTREELSKIARFIKEELGDNIPWHLSAFHPDYKELDLPRTSLQTLEMALDIGKNMGLNYVYIGNAGYNNNTKCKKCKNILIKRQYFNTLENNTINGFCSNCKEKLDGIFEENIRQSSFSGSFYPKEKMELLRYIEHFNKSFSTKKINIKPRAIISPHAGYIYSGFTANLAYNLSSQMAKFKRIIVIGPSHKVYLENASIALYNNYETPLGKIKIDLSYSYALKNKYDFVNFTKEAHKEHSTETQAPFIKKYFNDSLIVELVYGKMSYEKLSTLIDDLLQDKNNFIVISTDLSHFYNLKKANKLDNICLNAIIKKDLTLFDKGCEACGLTGVKAIIKSSIKYNLSTNFLHYCTSYDNTKDDKNVVGYASVLIGE